MTIKNSDILDLAEATKVIRDMVTIEHFPDPRISSLEMSDLATDAYRRERFYHQIAIICRLSDEFVVSLRDGST